MRFTTEDGRFIVWNGGKLLGDPGLIDAVNKTVAVVGGEPVAAYDWWGGQTVSLLTEWDAYVTIGWVLTERFEWHTVDVVPENPAGYQEETPLA